jgi:replicative DNA helicase
MDDENDDAFYAHTHRLIYDAMHDVPSNERNPARLQIKKTVE